MSFNPVLLSPIFPVARNPDPLPAIATPPVFPVAGDPDSRRTVIIWPIVAGRRIVPAVINRRGCYPDRWRGKKDPEMAAMVSTPG
jgi:hypothetical protein